MLARRAFISFAAVNTVLVGSAQAADAAPLAPALDAGVVPTGSADANVTTLQAAVDAAAAAGEQLSVHGTFSLSGPINVPSNSDIDLAQAVITQVADLTPVLVVNNADNVRIRNLRAIGKTTDYVNDSSVYHAAAVRITGTSSDVRVLDCVFLGMAGLGVFIGGATSDVVVRGCRMSGPGPAFIKSSTCNYSAGVAVYPGATRWSVEHNDISAFAQGIVTGDNMVDVRIIGNLIHDIPGQHGLYLETMTGGVIANNIIHNTGLTGMKIQVGTIGATDGSNIVVHGNAFRGTGAQGILLVNPVGGPARFRHVAVTDNLIHGAAGHGIEARAAVGLHVADNIISGISGGAGVRVEACSRVSIVDNRVDTVSQMGVDIRSTQDYEVRGNRITNPATGNGSSTEWGIGIDGASTTRGIIEGNRITDTLGNMRYGIAAFGSVASTPDLSSHVFRNNYAAGATDYGYRGAGPSVVREWSNNAFSGATGAILGAPTSGSGQVATQAFGSRAPLTGAHSRGEIVWNTAPAARGMIGWVCIAAGTPGIWKAFGAIAG